MSFIVSTSVINCTSLMVDPGGPLRMSSCSNHYGAQCNFSCTAGHRLKGSSSVTCVAPGNRPPGFWDNSLPTCQGKWCRGQPAWNKPSMFCLRSKTYGNMVNRFNIYWCSSCWGYLHCRKLFDFYWKAQRPNGSCVGLSILHYIMSSSVFTFTVPWSFHAFKKRMVSTCNSPKRSMLLITG